MRDRPAPPAGHGVLPGPGPPPPATGRLTAARRTAWVAHAAAAWALIFAFFHFIWALGWYPGLDAEAARAAFAVRWKLIYDLGAGVMCVIAVPVALAMGMPWGRRVPRRVLGSLAWTGTGLLALRSVASLIQTGYQLAVGRFSFRAMGIWEPWFYLGATLWVVATWRYWRSLSPGLRRGGTVASAGV